ncbi:hypothetical protein SCALIN_C13_0175 [Candidatus Scalindua japonica]|uniref:SGNH hydrolase-type esterase domain-containing protein n=2 Tax=Candidatus Scalindua japonica TaxID=1284222 RepID=A0A286TXQ5_9BACT|nr:hypothetical protein SCALIN_C13_0175 [Candidatus Scalindua japonica]
MILRFKRHHIENSDHLDYGMMVYDKDLGWKLDPNWNGRHKHYDYDVSYSINSLGFRTGSKKRKEQTGLTYAFVGDSFTFSFGVNDSETFIQLLNSRDVNDNFYLNYGIPGYSTDQEYLLIKKRILKFSPDVVLLVVYLGNDLFDNELPFPLQANRGKPFYELISDELILRNTPVPMVLKPAEQYKKNLTNVVLGEGYNANSLISRIVDKIELFRLLKMNFSRIPDYSEQFKGRFNHAINLFLALVDKIHDECTENKVKLSLILMPGRSYIERPNSVSSQFQDYLREIIVESKGKMNVDVIDLATRLCERYKMEPGKWFYSHEGHLTAEGHRVVSDILLPILP